MSRLIIAGLACILMAGCITSSEIGMGAPIKNVPVMMARGASLDRAVLSAAARRHWTPKKISANTYRLTITQRANTCSVDVVLAGNKSFSIFPVASNIPLRKYDQWVDNLQREIIFCASGRESSF